MAKKDRLSKGLIDSTEEGEQEIFEEATTREIKKKKEPRSAQFNVLLPPSLHRDLIDASEGRGVSANDILNECLEAYIEEHQKEVAKGRKIRQLRES